MHTHWLNNVVDRWALEEIVQKTSPLHEQDLAKLVSAHFSDVLQQIADRDQNVGDTVDDDDDDGASDAGASMEHAGLCPDLVPRQGAL